MTGRRRYVVYAVLAALTFAVFAGVLGHDWIQLDDSVYVYDNPVVSRGLTAGSALHFLFHNHGLNWVPVTAFSHLLDVRLYGLEPRGHHATNLLLHVVNTLLVAIVLRRLTGAWWRSVVVAAVFAVHPLRVESVAWIAERKDVLSLLFFLLTLLAYARWAERPRPRRYLLVFTALLLGLWSKPMLITLPFVLVLIDVWPLGRLATGRKAARSAPPAGARPVTAPARPWWGLLAEKWALLILIAVVTAVTYNIQSHAGALPDAEVFTFGRRLANALIGYWRYIAMIFWPYRLSPFYPHEVDVNFVGAAVAAAGLLAVTLVTLGQARRRPYLAFGWLWYLGTLLPAVGLIQTGMHAYADRFTYIPGLGLAIAVVWGGAEAVAARPRPGRPLALALTGLILATLSVMTVHQLGYWRNSVTHGERVLEVSGDNPLARRLAHQWIGRALYSQGRRQEAAVHFEKELGLAVGYEDSLRGLLTSSPDDLETRRELAATLTRESRVEDGVEEYRGILSRSPDDLDALNNIAWIRATHEFARHRDGAEALRLALYACEISPEPLAVLYSTLAAASAEAGKFPEAVEAGRRAVALAGAARQAAEAERYAQQLREYEAGRPFHHGY